MKIQKNYRLPQDVINMLETMAEAGQKDFTELIEQSVRAVYAEHFRSVNGLEYNKLLVQQVVGTGIRPTMRERGVV